MFGRKKKKKAPEPNLAVPDGAMKAKTAPGAEKGSTKKASKPRRPPKLALKGGDGEKSSWKQRISISSLLLSAVLTCILTGGIVAGGYALTIVYENKLSDTWAILFLELESYGNRLTQKMNQFEDGDSRSLRKDPSIVLKVIEGGARYQRIQGDIKVFSTPGDFHLQSAKPKSKWTVLQFAGNEYLTAVTSSNTAMKLLNQQLSPAPYLVMWQMDLTKWFADAMKDPDKNATYVITKEGRLVFSNRREITQLTYIKRPLVQKFIAAPLNQGQLEFTDSEGSAYGFFYEVPNTNLILFTETLKSVALARVWDLATHFGVVLFFILSVAGILLQFPLASLIAPMKELVRLAAEIGDGNFAIRPKQPGFGELRVLSSSFVDMAKSLHSRDERINMLLIEQQEKFRLANELSIAQSIQDNFIFKTALPEDSGLEVAAQYTPAAEVAGDWYGYFFNEASNETVFAIADVSGHGAGSAMFTAIIASTFEECRSRSMQTGDFPLDDFARRLNRLFIRLGHGKMHATLLLAKYHRGKEEVQLLNAGHPFPLLVAPSETGVPAEPIAMPGDLVGMSLDFKPTIKTVTFPRGYSIFMFTDGLIEGSPDHRLYRDKRLSKMVQLDSKSSINHMVESVYRDFQDHLKGQQAVDDVCLLAVRAAA